MRRIVKLFIYNHIAIVFFESFQGDLKVLLSADVNASWRRYHSTVARLISAPENKVSVSKLIVNAR